jgi:hypothetical protein
MRYKIQLETPNGWSNLRESSDGGPYKTCFYPTRMDAVGAVEEFAELLESTRIVPANVPETENIYA